VIILTGPPAGFILPFLPEAERQNEVVIEEERAGHELKDAAGDLEDHAIDTGDLDAEQTVAEVRRVLASGRYRLM
jgi:hypothetical protein